MRVMLAFFLLGDVMIEEVCGCLLVTLVVL